MQRLEDTSTTFNVVMAIVGYSLCSSTMLLANKMAMESLPSPSTVSLVQLVFATATVLGIRLAGFEVDWFDWDKSKAYGVYVVIFVAALYTNMQALKNANVETVIVFRACSPISVCVLEYLFLNRSYPSLRSAMAMLIVAVGAVFYCISDSQMALGGIGAYMWVTLYFMLITVEMTYGKVLTSNIKMQSVWGPVLYCNAFSVLPMFMISYSTGELNAQAWADLENVTFNGWMVILFSCVVGTLIGYTSWLCRSMVSATTFTLVGVVNKLLTVLLNVAIWDKHSTPAGLFAVCVCLFAGTFYQQAPRRDEEHRSAVRLKEADSTPVRSPYVTPAGSGRKTDHKGDIELQGVADTEPLLSDK